MSQRPNPLKQFLRQIKEAKLKEGLRPNEPFSLEPDPERIYCTTFCNHGHRLRDGKPVNHECYILPPKALEAERDGDYEKAQEILSAQRSSRKVHKGLKRKD